MAITKLFLIRHGQSDGNAEGRFGGHGPTPLSKLGEKQAHLTAKALAKEGITAIFSSDLHRAVQTAEALSKLAISATADSTGVAGARCAGADDSATAAAN